MTQYKNREYEVVPYDPTWPAQFRKIANEMQTIWGSEASIEHIGSTAVPGMGGKPTIDLLILLDELSGVDAHTPDMEKAGYLYAGAFVMPDSRLFRKMAGSYLLANIHIFSRTHLHVKEMIALRDYLRTHPDEADAYASKKKELYEAYPNDYARYRKEKDVYVDALKARIA